MRLMIALLNAAALFAQVTLVADGRTDTYKLIDKSLGGTAEETPDCSHPDFGPHITQVFDIEMGQPVFLFHIHATPDNDRCVAFDRQRTEIKTYGPSPDYLKGFYGDTVTFRWKFKLDAAFQPSPSFTHMHQIKAGDGDDSLPLVTLTAHAGKPNKFQLIHVDSRARTTILVDTALMPFTGRWIGAYEQVAYGYLDDGGTYSATLTDLSSGRVLLTYTNANLDLWRSGTTFVRPKWGIYRGLDNPDALRDETVKFNGFCLAKGTDDCNAPKNISNQ